MNIFVLDTDHTLNAQYHCDKHIVKMIVESAQLLCNAHTVFGEYAPYKLTHANHPCSIWTRECIENYDWLVKLGYALCLEYTYRYDKIHKTQAIIEWCYKNQPELFINRSITPFALAMPTGCIQNNAVESYRNYYKIYKNHIAKWTGRSVPYWYSIAKVN